MNDYQDKLNYLKNSSNSSTDYEKTKHFQIKESSFSFNPFKNLKKEDFSLIEVDTPAIASNTKINSKIKDKNELLELNEEKIDHLLYSSSYSGILNSHDSSIRTKGMKEFNFNQEEEFNSSNMIMIENEH